MSDSNEIQRQIAADRAALNASLNALGNRLTVDNLATEATHKVAGVSEDLIDTVLRRLGANAQTRPVATALVGAGMSWLLSKPAASREYRPQVHYNGPKPVEGDPDRDTLLYAGAVHRTPSPTQKVKETMEHTEEKLAEIRQQAANMRARITEGTEELTEEARARVVAAREKAVDAAEAASRTAAKTARSGRDFVQENPMMVGGLALAVGAAVAGAVLWKRSGENKEERREYFDEADRIYDEEIAKARGENHETVLAQMNG